MKMNQASKAALITTGIKVGVPVVAIGVGVLLVRRAIKKNKNHDGSSPGNAPSLDKMTIEGDKLTITPTDAALFANTLYGAMLNFGTDEKAIYSTIDKVNTKDDMLLVIRAFGMKKYLWGARDPWFGQKINLIGWLRSELKEKEIAIIKPKFDSWGIPL